MVDTTAMSSGVRADRNLRGVFLVSTSQIVISVKNCLVVLVTLHRDDAR